MISKFPIEYEPGNHERELSKRRFQVGDLKKLSSIKKYNFVFICFTNRSGSTWLGELLGRHKSLNQAGEPYNYDQILKISERENLSTYVDYFIWQVNSKVENGNYVSKISWDQLYYLTKIGIVPYLNSKTKFIYIKRNNIIDQAISYVIAYQSSQWTSLHKDIIKKPEYDGLQIINVMKEIRHANAMFGLYFSTFGVKKLTLSYEKLEKFTRKKLMEIIEFLSLNKAGFKLDNKSKFQKQRNELNFEFANKFKEEFHL